MSYHRKYLY